MSTSRAHWHHWSGGNLFNMRGAGQGEGGYTVTFRNIVVEDPRPTLQHFKILMEGGKRIKYLESNYGWLGLQFYIE